MQPLRHGGGRGRRLSLRPYDPKQLRATLLLRLPRRSHMEDAERRKYRITRVQGASRHRPRRRQPMAHGRRCFRR